MSAKQDVAQLLLDPLSDKKDIFVKISKHSKLRRQFLRHRGQYARDLGTMLQKVRPTCAWSTQDSNSLHQCLDSMPDGDPQHSPVLRLLQDLCSVSDVLPASYRLSDVVVDWKNIIKRGGEAVLRLGTWNHDTVVVRDALVLSPQEWKSETGRKTLKVSIRLVD